MPDVVSVFNGVAIVFRDDVFGTPLVIFFDAPPLSFVKDDLLSSSVLVSLPESDDWSAWPVNEENKNTLEILLG